MSKRQRLSDSRQEDVRQFQKYSQDDNRNYRNEARAESERKSQENVQKQIEEIRSSLYRPILDSSLECIGQDSRAEVKVQHRTHFPSAWEVFENVFGLWVQEKVLPAVRANCAQVRKSVAELQKRHYNHISYEELMQHFLIHFIIGAKNSLEKNINQERIAVAREQLTLGKTKWKVIARSLHLSDVVFNDIVSSIPHYLVRFISPGGSLVVDESIWPYYSPVNILAGLVHFIPEKPHQRGLLTYALCQRLALSARSIAVAFAPTFISNAPTPLEALKNMIAHLGAHAYALPEHWILMADALWSYPNCIADFLQRRWKFAISIKSISSGVPKAIREISAADLILGHAQTYADPFSVLQTYYSERGISSILTNAFQPMNAPPAPPFPKVSYETAVSNFRKDRKDQLLELYKLTPEQKQAAEHWTKERLVFEGTGWDVLRPEGNQSASFVLTRQWLNSIDSDRVNAIFRSKHKGNPEKKLSKAEQIRWLCPHEDDEEQSSKSNRKKRRTDTAKLTAELDELRGTATTTHQVYDRFHEYHSCIDEMNKEFFERHRTRYLRSATHAGLCHLAGYLLDNCHTIHDEFVRQHIYDRSGRNLRLAKEHPMVPFDDYLCNLISTFLKMARHYE